MFIINVSLHLLRILSLSVCLKWKTCQSQRVGLLTFILFRVYTATIINPVSCNPVFSAWAEANAHNWAAGVS